MAIEDRHSSGPFSRVWFVIDRDHRLSTFTHRIRWLREEPARTQVYTIGLPEQAIDTRWLGNS